ncbi:MAG: hypothetical protein ACMUIG_09990 [Thermoplasmatota archaeon]
MNRTSFIEQLLGTRTKIRILKLLMTEEGSLSRNQIVKSTGTGIRSVYEQTDQLIAIGALKEADGKVSIDHDFPYIDQLRDLFLLTEDHMKDMMTVLRSIDRILGADYYITGYASACQNGMPIDVDEKCILIFVKGIDTRKERMLDAVALCTEHSIKWKGTERIPKNVQRTTLSGVDVWLSSVETAIVDSIKEQECGYYPIFLLMVQNILSGSLDLRILMEYAEDLGVKNIFSQALTIISDRVTDIGQAVKFNGKPDPEVARSVELALNTVLG